MKKDKFCNYLGADWVFVKEEDAGIRLKSICKHCADVIVPYHRKHQIKLGKYQAHR
jgi:hypothetical protein